MRDSNSRKRVSSRLRGCRAQTPTTLTKSRRRRSQPTADSDAGMDESDSDSDSSKPAAKKTSEEDMDVSEDDKDNSDDDDGKDDLEMEMDGVDEQKLVERADDKKYLDSLPEIERESILAQRFEKLKAAAHMKKKIPSKEPRQVTDALDEDGDKKGS